MASRPGGEQHKGQHQRKHQVDTDVDLSVLASVFDPNTRAIDRFPHFEGIWWIKGCKSFIDSDEFMKTHTLEIFDASSIPMDMDMLMMSTAAADLGLGLQSDQLRQPSFYFDSLYYR